MKTPSECEQSERTLSQGSLWEKPWLSKKELARYLGFSQRFIDLHIRPFIKTYSPRPGFGKKLLFNKEEVDSFIRSRQVGIDLEIRI